MILVFDSSVEGFSVGLFHHDGSLVDCLENTESYAHTEFLVPSIQSLLQRLGVNFDQLTKVITTCGPGSFTGIRVGLATAAGLKAALYVPVVTVNTLSALVLSAPQEVLAASTLFHAVLDTKCGEFYHQTFEYDRGVLKAVTDPQSISMDALIRLSHDGTVITHPVYATAFPVGAVCATPVRVEGVFKAAAFSANKDLQPIYVRSANITQPKKHA